MHLSCLQTSNQQVTSSQHNRTQLEDYFPVWKTFFANAMYYFHLFSWGWEIFGYFQPKQFGLNPLQPFLAMLELEIILQVSLRGSCL